jgi:hypothetical protein
VGGAVVVSGPCKDKSGSIAVLSDPNNPGRVRIASYPGGTDTSKGLATWLP